MRRLSHYISTEELNFVFKRLLKQGRKKSGLLHHH